MRFILCVFFIALALGCAREQPVEVAPEPVGPVYIILPANYVIDVAASSNVRVNPAVQDFILYTSLPEAKKAMGSIESGAEGDNWRIFILEGEFGDLAKKCGDNYCLSVPARVSDWVE